MTTPEFWCQGWTAALVNHLWQSTVAVGIAWLLTLALRKNRAQARYWVWMAASVKFLLPFSPLFAAGEWVRSLMPATAMPRPVVASVVEQVARPFAGAQFIDARQAAAAVRHWGLWPRAMLAAWICGALVAAIRFGRGWWKVWSAKRAARPLALEADVPVLFSPAQIEPGVFGIFRPVLLLPEGVLERLSPEQLQTIVAHEMCHVRRRDNLTFSVHMIVETLFWFHPAVWWIGAWLVEERERACDEAVVEECGKAEAYAEGILQVCKFYVESPLKCVAGVTGAGLKERILRIMTGRVVQNLSVARKLLLGAVGGVSLMVPVMFGGLRSTAAQDQAAAAESKRWKFAVVSIRRDTAGGPQHLGVATADGYQMKNMFLGYLFRMAYVPKSDGAAFYSTDQFVGVPAWLIGDDDRYDVDAKVDEADLADWQNPARQPAMLQSMLQAMLEDRLKLVVHRSTEEAPVYLLVVGKNGPKFKEANPGELHPGTRPMAGGGTLSREDEDDQMIVHYFGISIAQLEAFVLGDAGRPIQDRTGLTGKYDVTIVRPIPESVGMPEVKPVEPSAADIANQLGLKLEPAKGQVETLVIDHVAQPTPN